MRTTEVNDGEYRVITQPGPDPVIRIAENFTRRITANCAGPVLRLWLWCVAGVGQKRNKRFSTSHRVLSFRPDLDSAHRTIDYLSHASLLPLFPRGSDSQLFSWMFCVFSHGCNVHGLISTWTKSKGKN